MKLLLENWRKYMNEAASADDSINIEEIKFNSLLALDLFRKEGKGGSLTEARGYEYEIHLVSNPNDEVIGNFNNSLNAGQRGGFLTPYTEGQLSGMNLYKLKGKNAGFAVKPDGDIVSVHNNSDLGGLAGEFMKKAVEVGGNKLDHFDGFLSGLYRKYGFTDVYEVYQWNDEYAPDSWQFEPVDAMNASTSVYAEALNEMVYEDPTTLPNEKAEVAAESGLEVGINPNLKYNAYKYGRPDIIMRRLA